MRFVLDEDVDAQTVGSFLRQRGQRSRITHFATKSTERGPRVSDRPNDGLVWSAFGPREGEKRPQTMRTSDRRKPKGRKDYNRIANGARTP